MTDEVSVRYMVDDVDQAIDLTVSGQPLAAYAVDLELHATGGR